MSLDGKWNAEISAMGQSQKGLLELKIDGNKVTGSQAGAQGNMALEGTTSDGGATATLTGAMTSPMPMTLEFSLAADGDTLSGTVKVGSFGTFPVKGARA